MPRVARPDDRPSVSTLLAGVQPARIARSFELRPDLLVPQQPRGLNDLVMRCTAYRSVALALFGCDQWCRQLAEVAVVARAPTSIAALAALVRTAAGDPPTASQVDSGIERLADRLLVFPDAEGRIWVNPGLVSVLSNACGLGPSALDVFPSLSMSVLRGIADLIGAEPAGRSKAPLAAAIVEVMAEPTVLGHLLDGAPPEAVTLLRQARSGWVDLPASSWYRPTPRGGSLVPHEWLFARGFLVDRQGGMGYFRAEVPREVGLALRHGVALSAAMPEPPPLNAAAAGAPTQLDTRAAVAAGSTVRSVTRLLGVLDATPAATLKDGGVGSREAGRLAKLLGLTAEEVFALLELAAAADLVGRSSYEPVLPTQAALSWREATPAQRWMILAQAWLSASAIASVAGRKAPSGKVVPALVNVGIDGERIRRVTLDVMSAVQPGERPVGDVVGAVTWTCPAMLDGLEEVSADLVAWTVTEAAMLGLAAEGALSTVGRALVCGDTEAARRRASALLVDAPAEVILQADLTAVVDASAPQQVLDELCLLAEEESAGAALVLRFSASSLRRGLDAGRDEEQILSFLAAHAVRGVPQPLAYLVTDTARRWGSVRVGAVRSYVRSEDPVLLLQAVGHRRLAKLALRLLAPTVGVCDAEPTVLLAALRDAGFLPVQEDDAGIALAATPRRSGAAPSAPPRPAVVAATAVDLVALAEALLSGPRELGRPVPVSSQRHLFPSTPEDYDSIDDDDNDFGGYIDDYDDDACEALERRFGSDPIHELRAFAERQLSSSAADLDADGVQAFNTLSDVLATRSTVEASFADPDSGQERAVTGRVVDIEPTTGWVMVEREPDGELVPLDPASVIRLRVLRRAGGGW